jgi:hypothetical protein
MTMALHIAVGFPHIKRNSDHVYTHVVIGTWPDRPDSLGYFGWSGSEKNAQAVLRTWSKRGAIKLQVVPVEREAV